MRESLISLKTIIVLFLMPSLGLYAQNPPTINQNIFNNTNQIVLSNYNEQMAGETDFDRVDFNINASTLSGTFNYPNWTVKVSAMGDYTSPSGASVPVGHTFLQFNSVNNGSYAPVITGPVQLGTSEALLVSGAPPISGGGLLNPFSVNYKYNFILQGGNHLLVPDGTYTTALTVSLYDQNNALIDSYTIMLGFEIDAAIGGLTDCVELSLQNGADNVHFTFDQASDYLNGLSISKPLGLKVKSSLPYQVFVKTSAANLTSTTTSNTIPVSLFKIDPSLSSPPSGVSLSGPVSLSTAETLIIGNTNNPFLCLNAVTLEYDLNYSLPAGSAPNGLGPGGTYTVQVFFILIPQ